MVDPVLDPELELELARRWHELGDHVVNGVGFGEAGCTCLAVGRRLRVLVTDLLAEPSEEPTGLGAVVLNPLTGEVWVRASHPALVAPDQGPSSQDWTDPTTGTWSAWFDLARPLLVRTEGWALPSGSSHGHTAADERLSRSELGEAGLPGEVRS